MEIMKIEYELSDKELAAAQQFMKEEDARWLARQKAVGSTRDKPYYGAIGGAYSWIISHTSIGASIKIKGPSGKIKDVTDYDQW